MRRGKIQMEPNEQDETQAGNDRVEDLSESYTSMPMLMELLAEMRLG